MPKYLAADRHKQTAITVERQCNACIKFKTPYLKCSSCSSHVCYVCWNLSPYDYTTCTVCRAGVYMAIDPIWIDTNGTRIKSTVYVIPSNCEVVLIPWQHSFSKLATRLEKTLDGKTTIYCADGNVFIYYTNTILICERTI